MAKNSRRCRKRRRNGLPWANVTLELDNPHQRTTPHIQTNTVTGQAETDSPGEKPDLYDRIKHGYWISTYKDGQKHSEGDYEDGKKNGQWSLYRANGKMLDEDIYNNGICVEMCEGDEYSDEMIAVSFSMNRSFPPF